MQRSGYIRFVHHGPLSRCRARRRRHPQKKPITGGRPPNELRLLAFATDSALQRLRLQPRHASLIGGDRRSSSGSLAKFTAIRRASSRVSRFSRRAVRRSDTSGIGGEAEARPNQSSLKQLTASFNDLVGAGKGGAANRGRNAAAYAVSEIPRLRPAPIMPASAIIISTPTNPPSAKAIAPPATPPLPPRKVPALTTPEP